MQSRKSSCRDGAEPPKNEVGAIGAALSLSSSRKHVRDGNGCCIATKTLPISEPGISRIFNLCMRLALCSSATTMLSTYDATYDVMGRNGFMTIGRGDQMSKISLDSVPEQCRKLITKPRRRDDPKTMSRHCRHTWTSVIHGPLWIKNSNIIRRARSGSMSIVRVMADGLVGEGYDGVAVVGYAGEGR